MSRLLTNNSVLTWDEATAGQVKGNVFGKTSILAAMDAGALAYTDIASAGTTSIGLAASNKVRITGTTTITSFGTADAGVVRRVRFAGALILTHNATSLILPTGANITTAANDSLEAVSLGSGNWYVTNYQRASGQALAANASSGWTDIESGTISSSTANMDMDISGFRFVRAYIHMIPVADGTAGSTRLQLSTDGSTYHSGASDYTDNNGASDNEIVNNFDVTIGNAADEGMSLVIDFNNTNVNGIYKFLHISHVGKRATGVGRVAQNMGNLKANTLPLLKLRAYFDGTNIASGRWKTIGKA